MSDKLLDAIVVGGGYIGQSVLADWGDSANALLVEASSELESLQFKLEIISEKPQYADSKHFDFTHIQTAKILWKNQWVNFSDLDFTQDDWLVDSNSKLPLKSWQCLCENEFTIVDAIHQDNTSQHVRLASPIVALEKEQDFWKVSTKSEDLIAKKIIWTTGIVPFQNCLGREPSKKYLKTNANFKPFEADYCSGLFVNVSSDSEFKIKECEGQANLPVFFAIQAKINGLRQLIFVFSRQDKKSICAFSYVHESIFPSPKEITSHKKAVVRALKANLDFQSNSSESWAVAQQMPFSYFGTKWKFADEGDDSIIFVDRERYRPSGMSQFLDINL